MSEPKMSAEVEESSPPTEIVDVDCSAKEIDDKSEITCDSGLETLEACSASVGKPSSEKFMVKNEGESDLKMSAENSTEISNSDTISSPRSLSPEEENNSSNNIDNMEESSPKSACKGDEINNLRLRSSVDDISEGNHVKVTDFTNEMLSTIQENNSQGTIMYDSSPEITSEPVNFTLTNEVTENSTKTLTMSTMSLNDDLHRAETNITTLNKALFSKSAENISATTQTIQETVTNTSQDSLNAEKILSDFTNQKTKAAATQKVLPDAIPANLDVRYPRLPKELLNQDLGSIYKNVHGIFSTVSGSLKNAYNISHRASTQKPVPKPVLNTKIINEIFEEDLSNVIQENGQVKPDTIQDIRPKTPEDSTETDGDVKKDVIKLQVETLERLLAEQRKETAVLRDRVRQQADELQEKDETFKDLEGKMDLMRKSVELAQREKDSAVMRYASGECHVIAAKRAADAAQRLERAANQELELLGGKLKSAHAEKQRICQLYDDKCHELLNSERELAKSREELRDLEGRLKWTQNRLRSELEAYKSSAERVESLQQKVSELEAARDSAGASAADAQRAKLFESDLKEVQAALILCRHEKTELERRVTSLTQQLATCERERDDASGALARTTAEAQQLRESNLKLEEEAAASAGLGAKAALADTLSAQLERESSRIAALETELSRAIAQRETCAAREALALTHVASLTAAHAELAQQADSARTEASALSADNAALRARLAAADGALTAARAALGAETDRRHSENRTLARKVAELTEELAEVSKKLEWEKGENGVLKKKHASAIKEINRELQRSLKRCEQLEARIPHTEERDTRAGSVSSLSSAESVAPASEERPTTNGHATDALPDIHEQDTEDDHPTPVRSADRQALIERIVSLQRAAARRAERCEFLEEHAKQLTDELRNKSRALRHLLCAAPAGALATGTSDQHKRRKLTKRDIARLGGGAMAAVWGGDASGMTLELSLEMNKRLQAVLEDTLLKNITLKENMDTLGKEISKLKAQKASETDSK